jgi:acyl-coenzyme A synthetase/AMP-(fatty) acid ligase
VQHSSASRRIRALFSQALHSQSNSHLHTALFSLVDLHANIPQVKRGEFCQWYNVERQCQRLAKVAPNEEAIWSRTGCYTWSQTYTKILQYANYFLEQGVKPTDVVGIYLTNCPEFMFAWMGLWALGAAPALQNHYVGGEALLHCIKIAGIKLLLVDSDDDCRERVVAIRNDITKLGINIVILDEAVKAHIDTLKPTRPPDSLRQQIKITDPGVLLYTSGSTGFPKAVAFPWSRFFQVCATTLLLTAETLSPGLTCRNRPATHL